MEGNHTFCAFCTTPEQGHKNDGLLKNTEQALSDLFCVIAKRTRGNSTDLLRLRYTACLHLLADILLLPSRLFPISVGDPDLTTRLFALEYRSIEHLLLGLHFGYFVHHPE